MIVSASLDFVNKTLGKPYEDGGRGPDAFDCWGLVVAYYDLVKGVTLRGYAEVSAKDRQLVATNIDSVRSAADWKPVAAPEVGDLVAMSRNRKLDHVGIWLGNNCCLHTTNATGYVVASNLQQLREGSFRFSTILFFRHNG